MELLAAQGFDEVTVSQIADAAGVSKMTVTNHFPRKEDLVFDRAEVIIARLADAVAARAPGMSPRAMSPSARPPQRSPGWSRPAACSAAGAGRSKTCASRRSATLSPPRPAPTTCSSGSWRPSSHPSPALFAEGARRSLADQPREEIRRRVLAAAGRCAFDLLEPSLNGYGIRA